MKKIGEGKYQKVYFKDGLVYKYARVGNSLKNKGLLVKQYFNDLKKINIPVPHSLKLKGQKSFLVTICEYCGDPLEQVLLKADRDLVLKIYSKIIRLGLRALRLHIAFYPKINQFTYKNGNIYFIDFYPSRTRQDFITYNEEKRKSLGFIFYGLTQKILKPTNELINLRSDLKREILNTLKAIVVTNERLRIFQKDIERCFKYLNLRNKKMPIRNRGFKGFVRLRNHYKKNNGFIILLPSRHLWTENLYKYDEKIVEKLFPSKCQTATKLSRSV